MDHAIIDDHTPDRVLFPPDKGRGLSLAGRPPGYAYSSTARPLPPEWLIPRSEWQARIEEREAMKARLSDIVDQAKLPCKDQGQTNYCHVDDTEVLTDRGWTLWSGYNGSDLLGTMNPATGLLEFQQPTRVHAYEHDGPVLYSVNRGVQFGVTMDHRMLVRKWDEAARKLSPNYTYQRAGDLGWYFGLPASTSGHLGVDLRRLRIDGDRDYAGDDFIAMLSLIVSDGYAGGTENTRNWVSFVRFIDKDQAEVRAMAHRTGFHECPSRPNVWIRYNAGALADWIRANCYVSAELGAHNKRVPEIVKQSSSRQIADFLRLYGDKSHTKTLGCEYFSTSKRAADDIQELLLRVGKRGTVYTRKNAEGHVSTLRDGTTITSRHALHCVHERSGEKLSIVRKSQLETETYKGIVYCATVPNGTLVTRRNGTMLISGNCWANATTHTLEIARAVQGEPTVILSAASVGSPITNYRNQGGYGPDALEYLDANGAVPESAWPANAIDQRYATRENLALGRLYRVAAWIEAAPQSLDETISLLLLDVPVAVGLGWWSHEVTYYDPLWLDGEIAIRARNSWGMAWGDRGYFTLRGRRMLPDDAVAPTMALPG